MGQTFITNVHPSFERVQRHKAALAEIVKNAVTIGMEQAKDAKTKPQGGGDAFDWAANLPSEGDAHERVANGDRAPLVGGFDWAGALPREKDL